MKEIESMWWLLAIALAFVFVMWAAKLLPLTDADDRISTPSVPGNVNR